MLAIRKRAVKKQLIHEMITIFCAAKHHRVGNCQTCSRLEEYPVPAAECIVMENMSVV